MVEPHLVNLLAASDVLEAAPDAWLIVDETGAIRVANGLATELFGHEALVGSKVEELLPDDVREGHQDLRESYLANAEPRPMGVGMELAARRADGSVFPVEISLSPIRVEGASYVIAAVRDVSAALQVRQELALAQEEAVLAEDRERLARDLHDTVIQSLFAVGLSLQSAGAHVQPDAAAAKVRNAIDDLDGVIREIRAVIFDLGSRRDRPPDVAAELARVVAFQRRGLGFEPELRITGDYSELSAGTVEHLVHTLREALSNVAKHADATSCTVELHCDGDELQLVVADNGQGPAERARPGGRGLENLASRARILGGTCWFGPSEAGGSEFRWRVPVGAE